MIFVNAMVLKFMLLKICKIVVDWLQGQFLRGKNNVDFEAVAVTTITKWYKVNLSVQFFTFLFTHQFLHLYSQASSLLNNLADSATLANQFIENNILQLLMDLMKSRLDDVDLIMPIASIFRYSIAIYYNMNCLILNTDVQRVPHK